MMKVSSSSLVVLLTVSLFAPRALACDSVFQDTRPQVSQTSSQKVNPLGRKYFAYTKQFGKGGLQDIIDALPELAKMDVKVLWISPVHPQTVMSMRGTFNDHYYWWKTPAEVDPLIGGWQKFVELVDTAKQLGIQICLDTVLDHSGYADEIEMKYTTQDGRQVVKLLDVKDPRYFRQTMLPDGLYKELETANDKGHILEGLAKLAQYQWDKGLPVFNHHNPEIFEWLFNSYRLFVDKGVRIFRLDAAKHIPVEFLVRFMNELTAYAREQYGEELHFILEYIFPRYTSLDIIAQYYLERVNPGVNVYFFDFPQSFELTRFKDGSVYGFHYMQGFFDWKARRHELAKHYIPMEEDHDLLAPTRSRSVSVMTHAISDFFSHHSTMMFHGGEVGGTRVRGRSHVQRIQPEGDVGRITGLLNQALVANGEGTRPAFFHFAEKDTMLAERPGENASTLLFVHRGGPMEREITLGDGNMEAVLTYSLQSDAPAEVKITKTAAGKWVITASGPVLAAFTLREPTHK